MATSQSHDSEESNDSSRRAVGERVKAGDAASGPREEREGGFTQPADHEENTWVSTWMGEQLVENQRLEKKSSNKQSRVTWNVTNSRSANQR